MLAPLRCFAENVAHIHTEPTAEITVAHIHIDLTAAVTVAHIHADATAAVTVLWHKAHLNFRLNVLGVNSVKSTSCH
jgi:hypothetical protein